MNLVLRRQTFAETGIFGELRSQSGALVAHTLEHAYAEAKSPDPALAKWVAKIPPGTFVCKRGLHRLAGMEQSFGTFEITGVEGHSNLLFHAGNFNEDSAGCVLVGEGVAKGSVPMITGSRNAFVRFLNFETGVDEFQLTVSEERESAATPEIPAAVTSDSGTSSEVAKPEDSPDQQTESPPAEPAEVAQSATASDDAPQDAV